MKSFLDHSGKPSVFVVKDNDKEKQMSDEQINIAIAEACGWKDVWVSTPTAWPCGTPPTGGFEKVPNYCNDLNAMHEVENIFSEQQLEDYAHELCHVAKWHPEKNRIAVYRATTRQRAEAFLKTIGKWEGVK